MPEIEVGDWLYASWGYDQTNASFWRVTKRTAKMVHFVAYWSIGLNVDGNHEGVVPDETRAKVDHLTSQCKHMDKPWHLHPRDADCNAIVTLVRKVQPAHGNVGESVWVRRPFLLARRWDGTPKYDTIAAGLPGH